MGRSPLAGAIHDLHARLGSIRMAVTAVAGLDLDGETRASMLATASEESVRAAAELAGLGALATCLLDRSEVARCDVALVVADAADAARLAGLDVVIEADDKMLAEVQGARLQAVLPALIRLVGGADGGVRGSAAVELDRVQVRLHRDGTDTEQLPPIAGYLIDALGARPEAAESGLAFSLDVSP